MNAQLLDSPIVLSLNRAWQVIGHRTVRQALVALTGGGDGLAPAVGLDIAYRQRADSSWDFERPSSMVPMNWEAWLSLPVRPFDLSIATPRQRLRVPTVIVSTQFARMPMRFPRPTRQAIYERDGGTCQYTGEFVGRHGGNLDHVIPRDRGGLNTFENLVWAKREVNALKANRLPHEAGLALRRRPRAPQAIPASASVNEALHPDWRHFL